MIGGIAQVIRMSWLNIILLSLLNIFEFKFELSDLSLILILIAKRFIQTNVFVESILSYTTS